MGSLLGLIDSLVQAQADSSAESKILTCGDDALDAHARNSNDRRALIEDDAALRAYLARRWDRKHEAGTEDGLHFQLTRLGYPNHELVSELDLRTAGIAAFGGKVGYAFVLIRLPYVNQAPVLWDDGTLWDADGALWGSVLSSQALRELVYTLQKWKPGGVTFRFIVLDLDGSTTYDGTGLHGNYALFPVLEPWEQHNGALVYDYNLSYLVP